MNAEKDNSNKAIDGIASDAERLHNECSLPQGKELLDLYRQARATQPQALQKLLADNIIPEMTIEGEKKGYAIEKRIVADRAKADPDRAVRVNRTLVTGNGYGYATLSENGEITSFSAHPYKFERAASNPSEPTAEGEASFDFVKRLFWNTIEKHPPGKSSGSVKISYLQESHIMNVKSQDAEQSYFMPFGLKRNALIAIRNGSEANGTATLNLEGRSDCNAEETEVGGRNVRLLSFRGRSEMIAMVPLDTKTPPQAWALLPIESRDQLQSALNDLNSWQKGLTPAALIKRELKELEDWRVKPNVEFASDQERKIWRQSETILRMSQINEANTDSRSSNGMINASLSGDFVIPFVRDAAYAIVGLTQMGHTEEARRGLMAFYNAFPGKMQSEVRGQDYQISVVRYFGDGNEQADRSGEATPNVELDNWGLALWSSAEYFRTTGDMSFLEERTRHGNTVYESMRDQVVAPLLANLDKYGDGNIVTKDSSNWEEHQQNKKHFAHTTITAIAGLRGFLEMAKAMHDDATVEKVQKAVNDLEKGFARAFIKNKIIVGSLERSFAHQVDGAVIEAFNFEVVKDPEVLARTLKQIEKLKQAPGGYRRVRGETEYENHEFLLIDFNMARLYFKLGRTEEGMKMLDRIVRKASLDNGQIPEMYKSRQTDEAEYAGQIGAPVGANPMVGYGAGAFIMTLEQREAVRRRLAASKKTH